ncbi:hypothetical protein [Eikenella corrodens]|uniref:Uncharacterized protein n=1 Tax=Eikenella corrodens TaxID=539 RepID=A0A3S9SHY4_EIKCO|nr:hypothetical protein [Eikenella corrodens]AZR59117.1 hypothetical protein ELB75_03150 [Eikenella corrodens]
MGFLSDVIIPNEGVANICLGENVNIVFNRLDKLGYEISDICDTCLKVKQSFIDIYFNPISYEISLISCGINFHGSYKTSKGYIKAGMTVADILQNTTEQVAWGGFVMVDRIHGIGFPLPEEFDDFSKLTDFLDYDFVFNELSVYKAINSNNLEGNKRSKRR